MASAGAGAADSAAGSSAAGANSGAGSSAATPAAAASGCELPREYTRAARTTFELTWPGTIGIDAGSGTLIVWSKNSYVRDADGSTRIESRPCGTLVPSVTTSELAGRLQSEAQIPLAAFDRPSMPKFEGSLTQNASMFVIDPGVSIVGATLTDPNGSWPAAADLMTVDHDGDGSPGVTAIPSEGEGFFRPPTSASQLEFVDRVYIASRVRLRVSGARSDCSPEQEATLEPLGFDYTIIGCHVQGRDACDAAETRFLASHGPRFKLGASGRWKEVEIGKDASCADVRAALPAP